VIQARGRYWCRAPYWKVVRIWHFWGMNRTEIILHKLDTPILSQSKSIARHRQLRLLLSFILIHRTTCCAPIIWRLSKYYDWVHNFTRIFSNSCNWKAREWSWKVIAQTRWASRREEERRVHLILTLSHSSLSIFVILAVPVCTRN